MKQDYSIEFHKGSGRYILWRLADDKKLRQGSHETYKGAYKAMVESRELMERL